jgi:hypothetical protein
MAAVAILAQKTFNLPDPPIPYKYSPGGSDTNISSAEIIQDVMYVDVGDVIPQGASSVGPGEAYFVDPNLWEIYSATSTVSSDPTPTPTPAPTIPDPVCADSSTPGSLPFSQADATQKIQDFCSDSDYWNITIVPSISFGTGQTSSGLAKAPGLDNSNFDDHTAPDGIWMEITFADNGCIGSFQVGQGATPDEKTQHCVDRFGKILNNCNTDTVDNKYGGTLTDHCGFYQLTGRTADTQNLFEPGPNGALICQPTSVLPCSSLNGRQSS